MRRTDRGQGKPELTEGLHYVDVPSLRYLTHGLTFDASRCAEVLDSTLVDLNRINGFPDQMSAWIRAGGLAAAPGPYEGGKRIVIEVHETQDLQGQRMQMALAKSVDEPQRAPVVFLEMHSSTLDIPMRVEIPLWVLMKGGPPLERTYTVYVHALLTDEGQAWVYYGITRRGWSIRFHEHTRAAVATRSQRLLAKTLDALIDARAAQLSGAADGRPALAGIVTSICSVGLSQKAALESEEYLVDKYSLAGKHPFGLNMIPGGQAGLPHAQRFRRRS